MDEKRKGEIAYKCLKYLVGKELSFKDIESLSRRLGNLLKEPEMEGISEKEALEFFEELATTVLADKIASLKTSLDKRQG